MKKKIKFFMIFFLLSILANTTWKFFINSRENIHVDKNLSYSSLDSLILEWNFTWGAPYHLDSYSINCDSLGNVYIAGRTNSSLTEFGNIYLAKFNNSGEFQWNQTFGGEDIEEVWDIAVDSFDNIYLAGNLDTGPNYLHYLLVKYNSDGEYQWNRTWGGSDGDYCRGISVDSADNIYLVGTTHNFTATQELCIVKYNSTGYYQWNRTWGGDYFDFGYDIEIDSSDNIYITGYYGRSSDDLDVCLVKYNYIGEYQWNRTYQSATFEAGTSLDLDSSNNIYITGITTNSSLLDTKMLLLKYNAVGTLIYERIWGKKGLNILYGLELDSNRNIFLAGVVNYSEVKNHDFCLIQFSNTGLQLSNYTWGGTKIDGYISMAIDIYDNLYLTGVRNGNQIYLEKYSIDNIPPFIWINSPLDGEIFGQDAPTFNLTVTDTNLHRFWYTINDTIAEIFTLTISGINLITLDQFLWNSLPEGQVRLTFFANDTVNNVNSIGITIVKRIPSNGGTSDNIIPFGHIYLIFIIISVLFLIIVALKRKRLLP